MDAHLSIRFVLRFPPTTSILMVLLLDSRRTDLPGRKRCGDHQRVDGSHLPAHTARAHYHECRVRPQDETAEIQFPRYRFVLKRHWRNAQFETNLTDHISLQLSGTHGSTKLENWPILAMMNTRICSAWKPVMCPVLLFCCPAPRSKPVKYYK